MATEGIIWMNEREYHTSVEQRFRDLRQYCDELRQEIETLKYRLASEREPPTIVLQPPALVLAPRLYSCSVAGCKGHRHPAHPITDQ